jgi:hypothetical protein
MGADMNNFGVLADNLLKGFRISCLFKDVERLASLL